jgi:hypothetical protein
VRELRPLPKVPQDGAIERRRSEGLQLQVRARKARGKLDTQLNKLVAEIFWQWGMPETCTVTGKLDWIGCQRLFVTQLARDGEALVQMIAPPDNPFGFALKFWNPDYLDETYNEELRDGRPHHHVGRDRCE